jgi:hypothetical protein
MADLATMLIERITQLERRLKELERREYTSGGTTPSSLTVEEEDATPSVGSVDTIQVPNGTLTDDGGGTVSLNYAPSAKGVTNGDSHDHAGGDGAQIDHGGLGGLADDDHTQYLRADGTRGLSADWDAGSHEIRAQTLEADVATGTAPMTIASTTVVTNLNADYLDGNHAAAFAVAAQGVTNGDSHDHAGGDGAQIDHTGLSNLNSTTYTHLTAANHTDLTDGGATTLHKHDHGGMDGLSDNDHPQYALVPKGARVYATGAQTLTTSGTLYAINFTAERRDDNNYHDNSTNNTRLTVSADGWYLIYGEVEFAANATGLRSIYVRVNGATYIAGQRISATSSGVATISIATLYYLSSGSYVELMAQQTSGGSLDTSVAANHAPEFSIIGPF